MNIKDIVCMIVHVHIKKYSYANDIKFNKTKKT